MSLAAALDILRDERCRCRWPNWGTCNYCENKKRDAEMKAEKGV